MRRLFATLLLCSLATSSATADEAEWRVPFITTPGDVVDRMLELAGTGPRDVVVDLGSGDGRIVIAAAQKFGARGLGIELDSKLVQASREHARRAGLADRVTFVQGDVLAADISSATVVTVYLLPGLMGRLQPRFVDELQPGTRIVSHAFAMAGWRPDRIENVKLAQGHPGQGDESRVFLWIVPADVRGTWRGSGVEARIEQNYQQIEVRGASAASLSGRDIAWESEQGRFRGQARGDEIVGEMVRAGTVSPLTLKRAR